MSDPAVEAAQRALNTNRLRSDAIDAFTLAIAREALAPIRDLIDKWEAPTTPSGFGMSVEACARYLGWEGPGTGTSPHPRTVSAWCASREVAGDPADRPERPLLDPQIGRGRVHASQPPQAGVMIVASGITPTATPKDRTRWN